MFKKVAEAYDVLSTSRSAKARPRRIYDGSRRGRRPRCTHSIRTRYSGSSREGGAFGRGANVFTFEVRWAAHSSHVYQSESVRVVGNKRVSQKVEVRNGVRRETVTETDMAT